MDRTRLRDVVIHRRQEVLVKLDQVVQTTLRNVESTETRQEIVANEEAEEDEVINDSLNVWLSVTERYMAFVLVAIFTMQTWTHHHNITVKSMPQNINPTLKL